VDPELGPSSNGNFSLYMTEWTRYFILTITIIVFSIPEGLPLAVMISLAYSVKKMLKDKNYVKRLISCEVMGGVNTICCDKTGTLTMNTM
jgi:P-type E1-E2 ATPase